MDQSSGAVPANAPLAPQASAAPGVNAPTPAEGAPSGTVGVNAGDAAGGKLRAKRAGDKELSAHWRYSKDEVTNSPSFRRGLKVLYACMHACMFLTA